jgi:hypothetical protein
MEKAFILPRSKDMLERKNTRRTADSIWKRHKVVEVGEALRLAASCRTAAPIRHSSH